MSPRKQTTLIMVNARTYHVCYCSLLDISHYDFSYDVTDTNTITFAISMTECYVLPTILLTLFYSVVISEKYNGLKHNSDVLLVLLWPQIC